VRYPFTASIIAVVLAIGAAPAAASSHDREAADAAARQRDAVTIFVDADWGRRTHGVARQLTEAHAAFAAHGYRLLDIEPYVENQDLQGFFVSYVRTPALAPAPGGR